jgi:hypothetical protein
MLRRLLRSFFMSRSLLVVATLFVAVGAQAASSASSAASDSASSATSSASDSLRGSSNSSSGNDRTAMNGDYRVDAVLAVAGRPDRVQLQLVPVDGNADRAFALELPQAVVERHAVGTGIVVRAKARSYGVEFALAATQQAFFLVVDDAVHDELSTHRVNAST